MGCNSAKQARNTATNTNSNTNITEPAKSVEDILIDMKMQQRQFENNAKLAERQKQAEYKKAQQAIAKNNEEGAKIHLQNYAAKDREIKQMQKLSHKFEQLQTTISMSMKNTEMLEQIQKIQPALNEQVNKFSNSYGFINDMANFEKQMEELLVMGKVTDELMTKQQGTDIQEDFGIEQELNRLKMENLANIQGNNRDNNQVYQEIKNNNNRYHSQFD